LLKEVLGEPLSVELGDELNEPLREEDGDSLIEADGPSVSSQPEYTSKLSKLPLRLDPE